jgi:hypothetical protein
MSDKYEYEPEKKSWGCVWLIVGLSALGSCRSLADGGPDAGKKALAIFLLPWGVIAGIAAFDFLQQLVSAVTRGAGVITNAAVGEVIHKTTGLDRKKSREVASLISLADGLSDGLSEGGEDLSVDAESEED